MIRSIAIAIANVKKEQDRTNIVSVLDILAECVFDFDDCHLNGKRKAIEGDATIFHEIGGNILKIEKAIRKVEAALCQEESDNVAEIETIVSSYFSLVYCQRCLKKTKKALYNSLWNKGVAERIHDQNKYKGKYAINVYEVNLEFISSFDNAYDFASYFDISLKAARSRLSYCFPGREGWSERSAWINDRKVLMQFVIDEDEDE